MESEIGVMWPWANEWQSPPETGGENGFSSEFPSGRTALLTARFHPSETDFGILASKPVRVYILFFQATKSVVICYISHRKLAHTPNPTHTGNTLQKVSIPRREKLEIGTWIQLWDKNGQWLPCSHVQGWLGGNVNWCRCYGKQCRSYSKNQK